LTELSITIGSIKRQDLSRILQLEEICFRDPWPLSAFEEMFDDPKWHMLTATYKDEIIGYATWMLASGEAHLANIAVLQKYRRKSVAKQFLTRIFSHCIEKGCDKILLEVRESNTTALSFYQNFEFIELYRRKRYYNNPPESAIVMQRMLESESQTRE